MSVTILVSVRKLTEVTETRESLLSLSVRVQSFTQKVWWQQGEVASWSIVHRQEAGRISAQLTFPFIHSGTPAYGTVLPLQ